MSTISPEEVEGALAAFERWQTEHGRTGRDSVRWNQQREAFIAGWVASVGQAMETMKHIAARLDRLEAERGTDA
jgi:hypothetical protein